MFYYPRFAGFFDDPFYGRRRRRRRDLFDTDPFMNFFASSDEEEDGEEGGGFYYPFYERRRIAPRRRRERRRKKEKEEKKEKEKSEKKKEENSVKKQKQIDPLSLFFRDFGNAYPFWLNEFYDEKKKERKEEKEEKKDDEIQKEKKDEKVKMEPISYKRIKTFSSINGKTESKEIVEDSRSGTKKEIHSKLIGDKMLIIVKKTTKEGKEEVLKKCEGIDSEEEFMKLWKANEQETKAIPEKKEEKQEIEEKK